jgi:uncharacterized SAM-binding protein YcdF (DUF218 family)
VTLGGLATPLVVPPANLAVLAALGLLLGRRRLAGAALAALLLLSLPVVANGLTAMLERGEGTGDPAGAQAIVVLGGEVEREADGRTVPGLLSLQRLRVAAALARRSGLPLLVSGGVTRIGAAPVADAMADSLREDFSVLPRWVEDRAADTFENASAAAALLAPAGVTSVLLVTQQWHMRRARLAFAAAGLHAIPAPVTEFAGHGLAVQDFVPSAQGWLRSYYALHEWIGIGWYALRARL